MPAPVQAKYQLHTYGRQWPREFNQVHIELQMWKNFDKIINPQIPRWQHLKYACLLLFKNLRGERGDWHPWLDRMCRAYAEHKYIAALGCASSTKTHSFHMLAFVDFMSSTLDTQVICTTTSLSGLKERVWPIMARLNSETAGFTGFTISSNPAMIIKARKDDTKHAIKAKAIERKANESEITDNLIGAHTRRIIWIMDEATSAPPGLEKAWDNLATGTDHIRLIKLGNPDDELDSLGTFCRPEEGWDSVTDQVEEWNFNKNGEVGIGLHFDGRKSPNLSFPLDPQTGTSRWPWMFGEPDIRRLESGKAEDPLGYYRFCVGWFADAAMVPKVMTMADIDAAKSRGETTWYGGTTVFASLDPAFGGDRPILKFFRDGACAETGKRVMEQFQSMQVPIRPKSRVGEEIGSFVIQKCKELKCAVIGIDTTTDNSAVAEFIEMNSQIAVHWITFGGSASDLPVSPSDKTPCKERYTNKVTELWFSVKRALPQIRGLDTDTCVELCSRYYTKSGKPEKLTVETKSDMKKRSSGKSPDLADALAIGVEVFKKRGGFDLPKASDGKPSSWKKLAQKKGKVYSSEHAYT